MKVQNDILILCNSNENDVSLNEWASTLGKNLQTSIYQLFAEESNCTVAHLGTADINEKINCNKSILVLIDKIDPNEDFKGVLEISAKKPTFLVYKQPISKLHIKQGLPELHSYLFSDVDAETGLDRFFNPVGNINESRLYWAKILDAAFDIGSSLFEPDLSNETKNTIYLAECSPDQYENHDAIRSELVHRGFKVLPPHYLKGENDEIVKSITNYLEQSSMSVHIVGNNYGENVQDSDSSLVELQCRLAAKHWRVSIGKKDEKQFQRIVWLPPGLKPSDERQRRFVATLRTEDKDAYSEVMQVPLEDLKTALREKISTINQTVSEPANHRQSVYIIYEKKDFKQIQQLLSYFESKNIKANYIDFSSNNENMVSLHFSYLASSDSVLICDFESNRQWINSKLKDLVKSPGYGRTKPFASKGIYTKDIGRYKSFEDNNQCQIIDGSKETDKALTPFLTKLNLQ
jgi:hypothetical protein